MTDQVPIRTALGDNAEIAADEIDGVFVQRVKVGHGVDGDYVDVSASNPLPVVGAGNEGLEALLTDLTGKDFATQTTLAALLAELGQKLEATDLAGLATSTGQAGLHADLLSIDSHVDGVEGSLTSLAAKDFATQAAIEAVLAKLTTDPSTATNQDLTKAVLDAIAAAVTGTLAINAVELPLPDGAASEITLQSILSATLTDADLRATPVDVALTGQPVAIIDQDAGQRTVFDYYTPDGSSAQQIRYFGSADQADALSDLSWTIKRLTWEHLGDDADHVVDLQTITGSWDDRATLNWS